MEFTHVLFKLWKVHGKIAPKPLVCMPAIPGSPVPWHSLRTPVATPSWNPPNSWPCTLQVAWKVSRMSDGWEVRWVRNGHKISYHPYVSMVYITLHENHKKSTIHVVYYHQVGPQPVGCCRVTQGPDITHTIHGTGILPYMKTIKP